VRKPIKNGDGMDALEGVTILDLTRGVAGPLGVLLLAEHGADVIKVEPPGGDPNRSRPEYRVWNRSRRSVTLDLKSPEDKEQFLALAARADVVVEDFAPGTMERLGLDYASLEPTCPRLVYLSVPAYPSASRHAARPGWDALVQARSGLQYEQPGWREGPIFLHSPLPSVAAGYLVPIGILAALSAREETGRGQRVETSLFQGAMALTTMLWIHAEHGQSDSQRLMEKSYPPGVHQHNVTEVADGWVHLAYGKATGRSLNEILDVAPDADRATILGAFEHQPTTAIVDELHANHLGAEAIVSMGEVLRHEQLRATGAVVEVDDPEIGSTTQLGITIGMLGTPGRVVGPRPTPGAHTSEVLAALTSPAPPSVPSTPRGANGATHEHALGDIRVLDFGRMYAGPFAAMVLASLGADVIKVQALGAPAMFGAPELGCGQGKRSIAVDLKRPEGARIGRELVARSDVVHHNMVLGVAERLGIDYDTLREIKPDIICCNSFMYGPTGPLAHLGGLDPLAQAAAGLEYEAGPVHAGNRPLWSRFGHGDTTNALSSVVGVLMALYHRKQTGSGQALWASLLHATAYSTSGVYETSDGPSDYPRLDQQQTGLDALYRQYPAHGGWIQLAAVTPAHWDTLCVELGRPDLGDDTRFSTPAARGAHRGELEAELIPIFATQTPLQWRRRLDRAGVPCEIVVDTFDGESVLFDEENVALGLVAETEHRVHGRLRQVGQLVTFGDTPGRVQYAPPILGQHTREIMEWLGYDEDTIASYRDQKIVDYPDD
jgi:crotonobetainyl-CoA:carnitine CoA-transferase CaiB-like acyl-CoA transferase